MTNFTSIKNGTFNFFQDACTGIKNFGTLAFRKVSESTFIHTTIPNLFKDALSKGQNAIDSFSGMDSQTKRNIVLIAAGTTVSLFILKSIWDCCHKPAASTRTL